MYLTLILGILLGAGQLFAADQTAFYDVVYSNQEVLNQEDIESLQKKEIILIPGIVSETFYWTDNRSVLDFSFIFQNYFGAQLKHFRNLNISTTRLWGSSRSVEETISEIDQKAKDSIQQNKKMIFVTHSLGGLALLDWMMKQNKEMLANIDGIVFLQAPFYGSPMASLYFKNPYHARTLMGPIMPFFNASEDTVKYLSVEERKTVMGTYEEKLQSVLENIPVITAGAKSQNAKSIFRPSLNIMAHGCLSHFRGKCRTKSLYEGPFDDSDGMVPFENSKLPDIDFVELSNVDHGETVLQMPFNSINRVKMTEALLKMILRKDQ